MDQAGQSRIERDVAARVGTVIAGKYQLARVLGVGSIGAVYEAVHRFTGRHVALKLLGPDVMEHEGSAARFLREARAAAEIRHSAICDVLDAGQEPDGTLYLVLELLEGRDLGSALEASDLRLDELLEVAAQLLDGLAAAHDRGIVHRDIKPENVFLTRDERGELHVKLLDFGIAKDTRAQQDLAATSHGAVLGTPYYMSPEQAAGEDVDPRADLWSVGAVLFHALTGRPPFDEPTYNQLVAKLLHDAPPALRDQRPQMPGWLGRVVDGALQPRRGDRWPNARAMADALRAQGSGEVSAEMEAVDEDATIRMPSDRSDPSLAMPLLWEDEPSVTVDVHGIVSEPPPLPPAAMASRPPPPPKPRRSREPSSPFEPAKPSAWNYPTPPPRQAVNVVPAKGTLWVGVALGVAGTVGALFVLGALWWFLLAAEEPVTVPAAPPPGMDAPTQ